MKLYNGIEIPTEWPPLLKEYDSDNIMPVPYLENRPNIICIDKGRQLFVDNFLIEQSNLKTVYHNAEKYRNNPVFSPQTPWEKDEALPCACPKSGGVWWDKKEKIYKMWYEAGWLNHMAYAVSYDGLSWERPSLDIEKGTNKILSYKGEIPVSFPNQEVNKTYFRPDSSTVWIDDEADSSQRYKMFLRNPGGIAPGIVMTSSDGIHWENFTLTSPVVDRSTVFYNPFRKKWVYSVRTFYNGKRARDYREHDDFLEGALWDRKEVVRWLRTDKHDAADKKIGFTPQLYNFDAVEYESIMLGMFQIHLGPENPDCEKTGIPKITELIPAYSRDGFHWSRPSREAFISASRVSGSWDRGYVQSTGGICIVKEDELWFYYSGFAGDETKLDPDWTKNGMYSGGATGIAKLRRDGFVSLKGSGEIITVLMKFESKNNLYLNHIGHVGVEILTHDYRQIAKSFPVKGDSTKTLVKWDSEFELEKYSSKPIRFKFSLHDSELYSFWVGN